MDPNVTFLYRAMHERDPRKRKVKPVAPDRIQVNFAGLDSDEDDSDFDIGKQLAEADSLEKQESDEVENNSSEKDDEEDVLESDEDSQDSSDSSDADEENGNGTDDGEENDSSINEAEADVESMSETEESDTGCSDEADNPVSNGDKRELALLSPPIKPLGNLWNSIDSDEDDEDYVPRKRRKKNIKTPPKTNKPKDVTKAKEGGPHPDTHHRDEAVCNTLAGPPKQIKVLVCCVCLSDRSSEEEEIVECDSCGITVHEGCYGISESHSVASTESSASTEPWFCDACKANVTQPVCELCPNGGGVFKETDTGKWVHLVCALYTPGVAFGDVDKLNLVTLFEMPYSKWGAKECILCEDPRFSQTGVCINCDAGMCKAYFHVTCAQREGLLAELSPEDVMEVADPFFAYCKLHADKFMCKMKRRNWLAIQSHAKSYTPCPITDEKEKARFQRKLAHHRDKYGLAKQKRPPAWVPTHKMVRHLHTSPSALRCFLRKAELMGIITQVQNTPSETKEAVKKAPPGQVSFTTDFIGYFMERNVKMDGLRQSLLELGKQNKRLQAQEKVMRGKYDKVNAEVTGLKQKSNAIRMDGESLCGMLADIYGKQVPNIPEVFMGRKKRSTVKKETSNIPSELINQCGVCLHTTDQHLLAKCDKCRQHYHLSCLDPPLTRMPKKTKLFGWQCSFCVKSSSGDSVRSHPDVNQPRKLRETIKGPEKFFLLSHIQDSLHTQRRKNIQTRKSKKKRTAALKRLGSRSGVGSPTKWEKASGKPSPSRKSATKISKSDSPSTSVSAHSAKTDALSIPSMEELYSLDIICVVCNKEGQIADTVRCDDCLLSYHLRCLSPPMKKSPKVRGYAWHCEACDMSDSDEEVTGRRSQRVEIPGACDPASGRLASGGVTLDTYPSGQEM